VTHHEKSRSKSQIAAYCKKYRIEQQKCKNKKIDIAKMIVKWLHSFNAGLIKYILKAKHRQ